MRLYHGSTLEVRNPLTHLGRSGLDFGRGFYLTNLRSQAEDWAIAKSSRKQDSVAMLNVYEFNDGAFEDSDFKGLSFDGYSIEWLDFVAESRKGYKPWEGLDYVQGGIANDNVIVTVDAYVDGLITASQALGQLEYKKANHQLCVLSQVMLDKYLTFIEAVQINRK